MKQWGVLLWALASSVVFAEDWEWRGHVKYQVSAGHFADDSLTAFVGGERTTFDQSTDFRVLAEKRWSAWNFAAHYEALAIYGDAPRLSRTFSGGGDVSGIISTLPNDRHRALRLTGRWGGSDRLDAVHRLDRLVLSYSGEHLVARIGRQAVSWGNGLIFHPLDIFSPFSPLAVDKDYKTGDDMLYGQWLFDSGNDIQTLLLPRRAADGGLDSEAGSLATKYHALIGEWDLDLVVARHFDETVLGIGASRDLSGALGRFDLTLTDLREGGTAVSLVTNLDYSWVWSEKNWYGFIEYFYNGVGVTNEAGYLTPSQALIERQARGETFTLARHYLGGGVQIEWTPLLNMNITVLTNLLDSSGILQFNGLYDWRQNLQVNFGLNIPYGKDGSEFGGIEIPGSGLFASSGYRLFARLNFFF